MSDLHDLHTEVQECRSEAARITEDFTQLHSQIEADPSLTLEGKKERLEPAHADVVDQISALHTREKTAVKTVKERIEKRLFGLSASASSNPAHLVSFRDAQSRAREINDQDDAKEVYQAAVRSDDKVLAAAILEKALVRGWTSIKDDFLERNSGTRQDLDDLAALAKYTDNSLMNSVHYMRPSLSLPHSAGMPNIPPLHSSSEPRGARPLRAGFGTW
ncbi:MAG: hypothetical protein PGN37_13530 [Mycobacterium kyogaense]|uniref:hypothetical protein n=1 Tax=Mycobacterium kyogaense TaxID=2212479 RepID=UPI002FF5799D